MTLVQNEPSKIYYIADMPNTFTKTFTNFNGNSLYESGYAITSITIEASQTVTTSNRNSNSYGVTADGNNSYRLFFRSGSQRGYSGYVGPYGGIFNFYPSDTCYCAFPSSATTSTKEAGIFTFTTTGASVKVGQTAGTWLYENSWTYTSAESTLVNGILSSPNIILTAGTSSTISSQYSATITYTAL